MQKIKLSRTPPSTQNIYFHKDKMVFMSQEGKDCKELFQWEIKSQFKDKLLEHNLEVKIDFYFGDNRKRDLDNYNKLILDACNGIVWKDDSQIYVLILRKFASDKKDSRVEISIK